MHCGGKNHQEESGGVLGRRVADVSMVSVVTNLWVNGSLLEGAELKKEAAEGRLKSCV